MHWGLNTCIQYTLVVFETRHTKAVFSAGAMKRMLSRFYLILLQTYYVRDKNVRNVNSYILQEKMCPFPGVKSSFVPFVDISLLITQNTSILHD